jgi:hypothetical protein
MWMLCVYLQQWELRHAVVELSIWYEYMSSLSYNTGEVMMGALVFFDSMSILYRTIPIIGLPCI